VAGERDIGKKTLKRVKGEKKKNGVVAGGEGEKSGREGKVAVKRIN